MRDAGDEAMVDGLRSLGVLLRGGGALRGSLIVWAERCRLPEVRDCADLLRIGVPLERSLDPIAAAWGPDGARLRTLLVTADRTGAGAAGGIDALASALERRTDRRGAAAASAAGARLSSRLIAALAGIPIVVLVARDGASSTGIASAIAGVLLGGVGLWWLARLAPASPPEAAGAVACEAVITALEAGEAPWSALACVPEELGLGLGRAAAGIALGMPPAEADVAAEPARTIFDIVAGAHRDGCSPIPELEAYALRCDLQLQREFQRKLRRAPVLMVLPVTLCLLPGFLLVAAGPIFQLI